ncbi:MAG TPA: helix-turn-helix transcriptional regulator [Gaiellaceae bacterium]|nr:helix-turn-helix transcriptional regulator [Gaiellaceae bacterium]
MVRVSKGMTPEGEQVVVTSRRPGEVFADRLKQVRSRKGWTQDRLSAELQRLGHPLHRVTLAKLERGGTRSQNVSLQDVLAIAAALGVAPIHLFVPFREDEQVAITPQLVRTGANVRAWVRGRGLLGDEDERFYFTELPPEEQRQAMAQIERAEAEAALPAPAFYLRQGIEEEEQ